MIPSMTYSPLTEVETLATGLMIPSMTYSPLTEVETLTTGLMIPSMTNSPLTGIDLAKLKTLHVYFFLNYLNV
jgi:hypothetical protein